MVTLWGMYGVDEWYTTVFIHYRLQGAINYIGFLHEYERQLTQQNHYQLVIYFAVYISVCTNHCMYLVAKVQYSPAISMASVLYMYNVYLSLV